MNPRIIISALLTLSLCSGVARVGECATKRVKAPFRMPKIKEASFPKKDFSIADFGAVALKDNSFGEDAEVGPLDSALVIQTNMRAISEAISACNASGGGRVVVPKGVWLTGAIHLKDNVNLHLCEGSELLFSDDPKYYLPAVMSSWEGFECYNYSPLVYAFDCENIALTGTGTLRSKMAHWRTWFDRPPAHLDALKRLYTMGSNGVPVTQRQMAEGENNMRPHLIQFNRCRRVLLDSIHIRESPFWCIHMYMCDGGIARNLDVRAHGHNNDGIDLDMTRNFLVENCRFDQGDDAVVIKSGQNQDAWRLHSPSENIVVRNCHVVQGHTLLGLGSELSGGIRNVYLHDCQVDDAVKRLFFLKTNHRRGGFVKNVWMSGIKVRKAKRVFEIDTDVLYQWRDIVPTYETRITEIDGLHLKDISCEEADAVYEIKGDSRLPARNITLENISVDKVNDFRSRTANVLNVKEKNVKPEDLSYELAQ